MYISKRIHSTITLSYVVLLFIIVYSTYSSCHATCLTCDLDSSANNCTSCDSNQFRSQSISPNPCTCNVGYIDASNTSTTPICIANSCSYTCLNLCQGSNIKCTACNGGKFRTLIVSSCLCNVGYYDILNTQVCGTCSTKCRSCSTASNACTDCYSSQYRTLSGTNCNCLAGYYDAGVDTCSACSYKCLTCTNAITCVTCAGGITRSGLPNCTCTAKYYDDGSSASCLSCNYTCTTCINAISCSTCNSGIDHRSLSQATGLCACQNRYYDSGLFVSVCASCHATCLTCTGGLNTNCLSCNSASNRIFNSTTGKCDCNVGFYATSNNVQLCAACYVTCYTCTGSTNTSCSTCNTNLFRTLSSNSCPCISGYYNNVNNICVACHSSCATCSTGTTCLTCPSNSQIINTLTGYCQCSTIRYWDSLTSSCIACSTTCLTCSVTGTNCTSCDLSTKFRVLSGNTCLCSTRYYDNGAAICASCPYACLTCDSTGCLTCNSTSRRTKSGTSCTCQQGYFDNGNQQLCLTCAATCLSCTTSASNCLTCNGSSQFRRLSGSNCICSNGYFDPGTGSPICTICSNACATCNSNFSNCLTCAGALSTRLAAPSCACKLKFYDDESSADCQSCHYSCQTCINGLACLTCDSTKFRISSLLNNLCDCNIRYYNDGTNQLCASCHPTCLTCSGPYSTNCLTCNSTAQRFLNTGTNTCDCIKNFYQTASTTQLCSTCHATCTTCTESTITSCLTCNSAQKRIFDGTNKCLCMDTFYLDSAFICQSCHISCATCSMLSTCLTCPSNTQIINSTTGKCQCPLTKSWDSSVSSCVNCDYTCATCSLSSINCTTCDITNYRTKVGPSCPCNLGYFDNNFPLCVSCHITCMSCNSAGINGCQTCDSNSNRRKEVNTCVCNPKYYDDGSNSICQSCHHSCQTCLISAACTTCDPLQFRQIDSGGIYCSCMIKFYEDANSLKCLPCLYHCASCLIGSRCQACNSANFRFYNSSTTLCQCLDRYYDDSTNQLCKPCLYDCLTCLDFSSCRTCDSNTDHRILSLAISRCLCTTRYYQDQTTIPHNCASCHYSCLTCSGNQNINCLTCNNTANRVYKVSTRQCACRAGYYDDGSNELCLICHYSCATCSSAGICLTCDSGTLRTLSTTCVCPTLGYYDNGSDKFCLSCQYTCNTCTNTLSCSACDGATNFRQPDTITPFCRCISGYYDDGYKHQLCVKCPYQCQTCNNPNTCLTCDTNTNYRYLPTDLCKCIDGYYDNGANNPLCATCQYSCKTCIVGNQCLSCNTLKYRIYDPDTYLCGCIIGFYDTVIQLCQPCSYTCLTCLNTSITCTSCNSTYHRSLDLATYTCPCDQYYYDDLVNIRCLSCHYSCQTCSDSTTCDTCDPTKHRQHDTNNDLCKCSIKYYNDGNNNQICNSCQDTCLSCTNLSRCTACDISKLRYKNSTANYAGLINPFCSCMYKYYGQTDPAAICLPCHYTCAVCQAGTSNDCLNCTTDAKRVYDSSTRSCLCQDGYFDNGTSLQTCLSCHPWCSQCSNPTTVSCTGCATNYYLKIDVTSCYSICPQYFYNQNSTKTCQPCSTHCKACRNATYCNSCDIGFPLYIGRCLSSCPTQSTYLDSNNNECINCSTGCLSCSNAINCGSCTTNYYHDGGLSLCFKCNPSCKGCSGPAQNQCTDCQYPLLFMNNQCFNITCPYGQYIHSRLGCQACQSLFPNSQTCNITNPLVCKSLYKLKNNRCQYCGNITGYQLVESSCVQICGDNIVLQYQCDDGNILDGDGCSGNCLVQEGWHCTTIIGGKSGCTLDGTVGMALNRVFKYGGQNKIKLSITLSMAIRLNSIFFGLSFNGLTNPNAINWTFTQSKTNLKNVQFDINYSQNIDGKQLQMFYDTSRRRLLQSITLNFNTNLTITSFPPANYYQEQTISTYTTLQQIIYASAIALLSLCLLNILFIKKTYIHIFPSASLPGQIFIIVGLVSETYTDWIKWSLSGLDKLAFIGGFRVGIGSNMPVTQYYNYPLEITNNMGITCCTMLGLWIIYGLLSIIAKYFCRLNKGIYKIIVYLRYIILTLQLCILPHISYSGINALYNSSLTSQSSSINVCLALFINIYIIGLIILLFVITKTMQPNQLMLQSQSQVQLSQKQGQDDKQIQKQKYMANLPTNQRQRFKSFNQTKQLLFLNLAKVNSLEEKDNNQDKLQPPLDDQRQQKQTQHHRLQSQSSRSQLAILDTKDVHKIIKQSKPKGKQKIQKYKSKTKYYQDQKNKQKTKEKVKPKQDMEYVREYDGIGYWYNNQQVYRNIQESYSKQWLIYDYTQLYATGGYQHNKQNRHISLSQPLNYPDHPPQAQNKNQIHFQKYKFTKFYLPITILKIYLFSLIASVLQSKPFILYLITGGVSFSYFLYILVVRPFRFGFSNFRVLINQIAIMSIIGCMAYYMYQEQYQGYYDGLVQQAAMAILAAVFLIANFLLVIQTLGAWRMQIWNKVQPCLVAMRLRGARQVLDYKNKKQPSKKKSSKINVEVQITKQQIKKQEQKQEQMNAFFQRMLQKQALQKQYRKERLLRKPKKINS